MIVNRIYYIIVLLLGGVLNLNAQNENDFYSDIANAGYNKNLITDYGVDGSFTTDDSTLLQQAIDDISNNGGGELYIDKGDYSFDNIQLKSNVHIVIDTLAVIKPIETGTKNYAIFNFGNLGAEVNNVSIKSNDVNGQVVNNSQIRTPNIPTVPNKDIKNRYTIDLTTTENKNVTVFRMNNVDNFYLSDFHVKDNYTKFSCIGMGAVKYGGLTKNDIKKELTDVETNVISATEKAEINNTNYINDVQLIRTECFNAIQTLLPLDKKSNAVNYLDILTNTFTELLIDITSGSYGKDIKGNTRTREIFIEEFTSRFENLVIDFANNGEPEYWFVPRNGVISNSSSMDGHYGYGLIQVQAAENVFFKDISGDGGATLRLETGLNSMNNVQIGGVDKIFADNVYNQNGNSSVMVSPHAMHNGTVDIKKVSSVSSGFTLRVEGGFVSKKYNQDIGLIVGTYGKVTVDEVDGVFGEFAQLKTKHDHLIPDEFNFDRTDPLVAATSKDEGESVTGPAIVTYLMSANYKCNNDGTDNVIVTNVSSVGFDYIGSTLEEGPGEVDCGSLSSDIFSEKKSCQVKISNNRLTSSCGNITKLKLYDILGNTILSLDSTKKNNDGISLQNISHGIYIINYWIGNVKYISKFSI